MKTLNIPMEDELHEKLTILKGKLTWIEFLVQLLPEDKEIKR